MALETSDRTIKEKIREKYKVLYKKNNNKLKINGDVVSSVPGRCLSVRLAGL